MWECVDGNGGGKLTRIATGHRHKPLTGATVVNITLEYAQQEMDGELTDVPTTAWTKADFNKLKKLGLHAHAVLRRELEHIRVLG